MPAFLFINFFPVICSSMENEKFNLQQQQQHQQEQYQKEPESLYIDAADLDEAERQSILQMFALGNANESEENDDEDIPIFGTTEKKPRKRRKIVETETGAREKIEAIADFAKSIFYDVNPAFFDKLFSQKSFEKVEYSFKRFLEEYFYPTEQAKELVKYISNGGNLSELAQALTPVNVKHLSDEEVIIMFYQDKMTQDALREYVQSLKETDKLTAKAKTIRQSLEEYVPEIKDVAEHQAQKQKALEEQVATLKKAIKTFIDQEGLTFNSTTEKAQFINSLSEPDYFVDDDGNLIYYGTQFNYFVNHSLQAMVIAAYGLWNFDENKQAIKQNKEFIENMKRSVIELKTNSVGKYTKNNTPFGL